MLHYVPDTLHLLAVSLLFYIYFFPAFQLIRGFPSLSLFNACFFFFFRYLQADLASDPSSIFNILESRGICTNNALLYEGWASILEKRSDFASCVMLL
jgi:hypothetical protein